tara:strand:- start:766 stop:1944 length:1179 start_codon:yes stop_codon:yes gene_type:complete
MNIIDKSYVMPTYGTKSLEFTRGKGCYLYNKKNEKFLDFASGIAVNSLGHCHPALIKALNKQSKELWHVSNLYIINKQEKFAKLLCKNSFADKVFFTNSGTESIECGLKIIRGYHSYHKTGKTEILSFDGAFHGRTFGAMSAQQNKKYSKGYGPLLSGFKKIEFNNLNKLKAAINKNTAAIIIEPIQGEGGIRPANLKFLKFIKKICTQNGILLFLDEVQCGFGRSGKLFSHEWAKIKPDIMAVAKGIGSGFPLGACLSTREASISMIKGSHGSTYGGNPLAMSVGLEVLKIISNPRFLKKVDKLSRYFWKKLKELEKNFSTIDEVRGAGLLLGIKTKISNIEFSEKLREKKLLNVPAADNTIRLAPPLIVSYKEIDKSISIIKKVLSKYND